MVFATMSMSPIALCRFFGGLCPQFSGTARSKRTTIVLSHTRYNEKTGLAVFCPITSRVKGYPFELAVPTGLPISGVVLCDHVRSQDWKERQWQPICKVPSAFVQDVLARTLTLFDLPTS